MKVLVTGAAGYIGSWLVPQLLAEGHEVTALDTMYFGSGHLPKGNGMLTVVEGDILTEQDPCAGMDAVIHLAAMSNNAMCVSHPAISEKVNINGAIRIAENAAKHRVRKFIYASSVAAYGSKDEEATETDELRPETPYGQHKKAAEEYVKMLFPNAVVVRSASVCGYSMNMAFHLTVNMMVNHACRTRKITVNGGKQWRCHVHIADLCDVYKELLKSDIEAETFNVVAQNMTVHHTAQIVQSVTEPSRSPRYMAQLVVLPSEETRSYTVDGSKVQRMLKWVPQHSINDAIWDMKVRFQANYWPDSLSNKNYHRIRDDIV